MKVIGLLLLFPVALTAQTHQAAVASNGAPVAMQRYSFHSLTMDDFITTSPEKGGTVVYNYDSTGLRIDGDIEINAARKFIKIVYSADTNHPMKAIIDSRPRYDKFEGSYTYKGYWTDTKEKTEITVGSSDTARVIKVLFGPHKGDYANYWDRIYKYNVEKK